MKQSQKNVVRQKLARNAGHVLRGSSSSDASLLLERNLKESNQEEGFEGYGLMTCCNKQSKTNKYHEVKNWQRKETYQTKIKKIIRTALAYNGVGLVVCSNVFANFDIDRT